MSFSSSLDIPDHEFRLVFGRTKIEYDPDKDDANRKKHNYELESAVWLLEQVLLPIGQNRPYLVSDSFVHKDEIRQMHMCVDDGGQLVFFVTSMRDDETVRVISMRRAHADERVIFQEKTGYVAERF